MTGVTDVELLTIDDCCSEEELEVYYLRDIHSNNGNVTDIRSLCGLDLFI